MDIDAEFQKSMDRITWRIDYLYLMAVARLYQVDINTVFIWRATGHL